MRALNLIGAHGFDSPIHAAMRADERLEQGDYDGGRMFQHVLARINQLLSPPNAT